MASRIKTVHQVLRTVSLPRSFQPCIVTRSLITHRVLHHETPARLGTKAPGTNFNPHTLRRNSNILQLLQKRTAHYRPDIRYIEDDRAFKFKAFLGEVILGLLIATSVTVYAVSRHAVKIPDSIVSKYRQLRDIDLFSRENFVLSQYNLDCGRWWTLVTSTFQHGNFGHLAFNMIGLYSFGQILTMRVGPVGLTALYVVGGLASSVLSISMAKKTDSKDIMQGFIGASGSVCSIAGAMAVLMPEMRVGIMFIPFGSVPAWLWTILFAGYSVYADRNDIQGGTAHWGHLGGLGAGVVLGALLRITRLRI